MRQRTFVMIKPDGVQRGLVGEIITTFERAGFTITTMDLRQPTKEIVQKHYPDSEEWLTTAGKKAIQGYQEVGLEIETEMGTSEPLEIGKIIKQRLVNYICSDKVVVMILEGNLAVANVRRLCGHTLPYLADPASIRGRFSLDSPDLSMAEKRPVLNLVHASGNPEEAEFEINLWFGKG